MSSLYFSSEEASLGRCAWLNTSSTPLTASASAVWMRLMRPLAMADDTTKPCARAGTLYSPAYLAAPVTFSRPSMREVGLPRYVVAVMRTPAVSLPLPAGVPPGEVTQATAPCDTSSKPALSYPFVRLRLRGAARGLGEGTHNRAPGQLDLEVVVAKPAGVSQHGIGRAREVLASCARSLQLSLRRRITPGFVRDPAEREARVPDGLTVELETGSNGNEREGI